MEKKLIEEKFAEAMLNIYRTAKAECNYTPSRFLQMLNERGGLGTARYLINLPKPSDGFTRLWELKRLDLSVESLVLQEKWQSLFTQEELANSRKRLARYTN